MSPPNIVSKDNKYFITIFVPFRDAEGTPFNPPDIPDKPVPVPVPVHPPDDTHSTDYDYDYDYDGQETSGEEDTEGTLGLVFIFRNIAIHCHNCLFFVLYF